MVIPSIRQSESSFAVKHAALVASMLKEIHGAKLEGRDGVTFHGLSEFVNIAITALFTQRCDLHAVEFVDEVRGSGIRVTDIQNWVMTEFAANLLQRHEPRE